MGLTKKQIFTLKNANISLAGRERGKDNTSALAILQTYQIDFLIKIMLYIDLLYYNVLLIYIFCCALKYSTAGKL